MIKTYQTTSFKNLNLHFKKDTMHSENSTHNSQERKLADSSYKSKYQKIYNNTYRSKQNSPNASISSKFQTKNSSKVLLNKNTNTIVSKCQQQKNNVSVAQQPKKHPILTRYKSLMSSGKFSQQFKIGKVLGKGRFGDVCLARHIQTNSIYAVKKIGIQKLSPKLIERIIAEIKIQFFLNHQNCLELYKFYKENNSIIMILEVGDKSLFDLLRKKRFFTQKETSYYIRQTIEALRHLHFNGIIHRDIKPQNIVLSNNVVKLADFGWSIYTGKTQKRTTFCGTLDYVCPQIVLGAEYDEMVDVWSVGVLCYQLSTGHAPFESNKSRQDTYKKILNVDLKFPRHFSSEIQDFINKLLVKNPNQRMSLDQALQHPWMKKYENSQNFKYTFQQV